ncbi:hypothetical protein EJ03DRAFT_175134 [Teratosphaeria nubilosa]|uniref:Uncharacterized protein n=1 Tax=Teratosphaeria nubilosa TaxID=161662 RepID=A0A6G1L340_9PEZI|nr:hypothetical protein EJ03DRAFT_175134 [Teratosphaeria nubilosa]
MQSPCSHRHTDSTAALLLSHANWQTEAHVRDPRYRVRQTKSVEGLQHHGRHFIYHDTKQDLFCSTLHAGWQHIRSVGSIWVRVCPVIAVVGVNARDARCPSHHILHAFNQPHEDKLEIYWSPSVAAYISTLPCMLGRIQTHFILTSSPLGRASSCDRVELGGMV